MNAHKHKRQDLSHEPITAKHNQSYPIILLWRHCLLSRDFPPLILNYPLPNSMGSREARETWTPAVTLPAGVDVFRKQLIDWWFIRLLMIYVIFLSYECFFSSNFLRTHCLPYLLGGDAPVKCISVLKLCNSEWQINFPIHFLSVPLLHLHLCLHHLGLNIFSVPVAQW